MIEQGPVRARWPDGRWHFQHGPIDLIIGVEGNADVVATAIEDCWLAFASVLQRLVVELRALRSPWTPALQLQGPVAARMGRACAPYVLQFGRFITPMAAVAGAVADHLIVTLRRPGIDRCYINNGGDIALHLTRGTSFDVGVVANAHAPQLDGALRVDAGMPVRGIATSGWRGRSFSLGIADAVTVLARTASQADAAATIIANAVDLPGHPAVIRCPANELQPDSDLGTRLVTRDVGTLGESEIDDALRAGVSRAQQLLAAGLIEGAALRLLGETAVVGATGIKAGALPAFHEGALERIAHV